MAESSCKGLKTLWEKEKLLLVSNFSFSHSVFKRPVLQTRKNQGLYGKGLKAENKRNAGYRYFLLFQNFFRSASPKSD